MKSSIDEVVRGFARFLSASWDEIVRAAAVLECLDATEFVADWLQANWELLVEMPFSESSKPGKAYLEPYGEGAECNDRSSRVWNPGALPTHRVICLVTKGSPVLDLLTKRVIDSTKGPVVFDRLAIQSRTGWHEVAPPFDCILGYQDDLEVLVRLDEISLVAEEVDA
jgi:hypothetical protein